MSDQDGPQAEQPELLTLADILAEHSRTTTAAAAGAWEAEHDRACLDFYCSQGHRAEAFTAGWRAGLTWYVALVTRPPLAELAAEQLRTTALGVTGHAEDCWLQPRCGVLDPATWRLQGAPELYCHRRKGHDGAHHLGH